MSPFLSIISRFFLSINSGRGAIEDSQTVQNDVQEWVSLIRQYRNLESLDRETLLRLIDKIEIDEQRIVDGLKEREIRIY